ncbi:MAG: hypothetical protein U1E53_12950 [Dongiaceae bacterium]
MFGLPGFSKLIVLVAILVVVWYGFKFVGQVDRARKQALRARGQAPRGGARRPAAAPEQAVEDMVKCRVCGTYIASRRPSRCSRSDCPW